MKHLLQIREQQIRELEIENHELRRLANDYANRFDHSRRDMERITILLTIPEQDI